VFVAFVVSADVLVKLIIQLRVSRIRRSARELLVGKAQEGYTCVDQRRVSQPELAPLRILKCQSVAYRYIAYSWQETHERIMERLLREPTLCASQTSLDWTAT
jgi:hypothetical protein